MGEAVANSGGEADTEGLLDTEGVEKALEPLEDIEGVEDSEPGGDTEGGGVDVPPQCTPALADCDTEPVTEAHEEVEGERREDLDTLGH